MYSAHWHMHLYSNELNFIKVVAILEYKYFSLDMKVYMMVY
ncbi:hypothetical protein C4A50_02585 [Escherichia coli]|uniref:Uncharacterized protein n=1 Tax=Escherichia coli TaxID=562 RepID=A0A376Y333_ECOLX|nr:hypothetical protein RW79_02584 [Escherichia coli]RDP10223.1 hypothetical protein C4A59_02536 [Escherichia coli]RDP55926.1 hypothetical protein C4A50_02585 [Escherichia coli]STJ46222.1 Uncharacterised protein [Escherichia coli]STJ78801.1 Uncharacterised protein [Escherichia coli]